MWHEGASFNPDDIPGICGIYASVGDGNYNTQAVLIVPSAVIDLKGLNEAEYGGSMTLPLGRRRHRRRSSALYLDFFSLAEVSAANLST